LEFNVPFQHKYGYIRDELHVSPPVADPGVLSRGCKVKNVITYMKPRFRQHFIPSKEICVDESTVSFKGSGRSI